jgi:hypothetical protein
VSYVPKSIQRAPLLTPSRLHSYQEAITLGTGLGNIAETRIGVSKNACEIDDKNRIKEQFISSQSFH